MVAALDIGPKMLTASGLMKGSGLVLDVQSPVEYKPVMLSGSTETTPAPKALVATGGVSCPPSKRKAHPRRAGSMTLPLISPEGWRP